MKELLDKTEIPEGLCCIDNVEISYLDGRSYGTDSLIKASGLLYKKGKVEEYKYEEADVDVSDFIEAHKTCVFMSDGKLSVWDELEETEVNALIRNYDFCGRLFPDLLSFNDLRKEWNFIEFIKMQHLYKEQMAQGQSKEETSLSDKIRIAEEFAKDTHPANDGAMMGYEGFYESVLSVGRFADDETIEKGVLESDKVRNMTLNVCYSVPGYELLSREDGRKLYDAVKKAIELSFSKEKGEEISR